MPTKKIATKKRATKSRSAVQRSYNDRKVIGIFHKLPIWVLLVVAIGLVGFIGVTFVKDRGDSGAATPPLWSADFEDGNYKFGVSVPSGPGNLSLTNDGYGGGNALRIFHPKNQYYGAAWYPKFSNLGIASQEDVYFRYYLKPDPNYHFRLEAKIPGIAGNTGSDGYFPSGCDAADPSRGWSGRLQWGLGPNYNYTKGRIQTYLYVGYPASNTGGCGFKAEWDAGAELERGKWACIEIRYKMNTPGQRNGIMQGWFNGIKRYERSDILFRNNISIKSNTLANVFYHGGTAAWQPIQDQYLNYDKLAISNQPIGCGTAATTPAPTTPSPTPTNPVPANPYTFTVSGQTLKWQPVPNATLYKIFLADTQSYVTLPASATSYVVPPPSTGTTRSVGWTWYDGEDHWVPQKVVSFSSAVSPPPVEASVPSSNSWASWVPGGSSDVMRAITRSQSTNLLLQYSANQSGYRALQYGNYCLTVPSSFAVPNSITFSATYNPNNFNRVYMYAGSSTNKIWQVENTSGVVTTKSVTVPLSGNRKVCFGNEIKSNFGGYFPVARYLKINSYNFNR